MHRHRVILKMQACRGVRPRRGWADPLCNRARRSICCRLLVQVQIASRVCLVFFELRPGVVESADAPISRLVSHTGFAGWSPTLICSHVPRQVVVASKWLCGAAPCFIGCAYAVMSRMRRTPEFRCADLVDIIVRIETNLGSATPLTFCVEYASSRSSASTDRRRSLEDEITSIPCQT